MCSVLVAVLACIGSPPRERGMLEATWTPKDGLGMTVPFSYESDRPDHNRGEMFTTLGRGGAHLHGPYTLVEQSTKGHLVTEVYNGFGAPEWATWDHDAQGHWTATNVSFGDFAHFYTGQVVASLRSQSGLAMRCRLQLNRPDRGLLEGGTGHCQLSDGGTVDLSF